MAGYVIHSPTTLSAAARRRIGELVAMDVLADGTPAETSREAGFAVVADEDVTEEFRRTTEAIIRARERLEKELRAADGNEVYEEDHAKKVNALTGIDEGLLLRSLIVVEKS